MAVATSTVAAIAAAATAASSIIGGIQAQSAAEEQSALALQQAGASAAEQERLAFKEAQVEQETADTARKRQKLAYLKSGVSLAGSPLLVMEETRRKGAENVEEILKAGEAGSNAALAEGRIQASQIKSSGRQAFARGITGGMGQIAGAF